MKNATVQDAHQRQAEGYTYVDVRSEQEFREAHPTGAFNVPLLHRDDRSGQMVPNADFLSVMRTNFPPDARLLIGCQAGRRSVQAAQILEASGYQDVTNVLGGFGGERDPITGDLHAEGWLWAGLPVERGDSPGRAYVHLRRRQREGG
jgi:rhodanese-related sulfurtransferase